MQMKKYALAALLPGIVAAAGCAGERAFRDGKDDELLGRWDRAVIEYSRAREQNPRELKYRMAFERAKRRASEEHFEKGKMYLSSGRPELAVIELEQTVLLNSENDYAKLELTKAREQAAKLAEQRKQPSRMEALQESARGARAVGPILQPTSKKPISLNFPQPRPIKQIYQALGQAAGINVIFDPALKDDQASILLSNVNFQNALETLIRQENHFYKVTDEHTILIAADTPANRKTYEDLVIRSFYLSNGDVTETANAIRALLGTVHVSINKQENAITIRDTADKVSIAQSIIDQNDKEKAEVVVDVELLQMNATKSLDLGLSLPRTISGTLLKPSTAPGDTSGGTTTTPASVSVITLEALKHLSLNQYGFTVPNFTVNLIKDATDAQVLARPELRISEGEKAQLIIGDKVPIPTTTFNTQTAVGGTGAIVPITSFQYQDVGIKIEMEPRVHHNREVTLKLTVEVSNLNGSVTGSSGQSQPIIGTRTISSTIRLKDGETNFLAGLIRQDKSNGSADIPVLSDIPIIGRLFSHKTRSDQNTDLVMTITPHIIRVPDINAEDLMPVFVGTENNISYRGAPQVESFSDTRGPFDNQPRRPGTGNRPAAARPAQPQPGQPPPGINLAPSGGPTNLFAPPKATAIPKPANPPPPPSGAALTVPVDPEVAAVAATPVVAFAFEPSSLALKPGEEQTVALTSSGGDTLASSQVAFEFDPAVVQVAKIESLEGSSVTPLSASRLSLTLPDGFGSAAPRTLARVTLRGVATGSASVRLDASSLTDASGAPAIVSSGTAAVEVK
jgi:general secretion pathway protein D